MRATEHSKLQIESFIALSTPEDDSQNLAVIPHDRAGPRHDLTIVARVDPLRLFVIEVVEPQDMTELMGIGFRPYRSLTPIPHWSRVAHHAISAPAR
jgi:hypothetical protein